MNILRRLTAAVSVGLLAVLAFGTPVFADTVLKQSGHTGDYGTRPHSDGSEARCNYVKSGVMIGAWDLVSISTFPVGAGPASGKSTQKVSWSVTIQSAPKGGGAWTKLATSATQTGTATNLTSPNFTTIKVAFTGKPGRIYREASTINWLTSGSSTGLVKFIPDIYGVKFNSTVETLQFEGYCYGQVTL